MLIAWAPLKASVNGGLNQLLTHVPLILMAVLAFVSFAVVKQAPSTSATASALPSTANNDHFLKQFTTTSYDAEGLAKVRLRGESAVHNPAAKEMRLETLNFIAVSHASGVQYTGSAKTGTVADGAKQFSLSQQVVIDKTSAAKAGITPEPVHFRGEQILFTVDPDTVTSKLPVRIQSGTSNITADTLHYAQNTQQMQLKGRVRMLIERR
jgi:LPS export ABC transporter protein LptC